MKNVENREETQNKVLFSNVAKYKYDLTSLSVAACCINIQLTVHFLRYPLLVP